MGYRKWTRGMKKRTVAEERQAEDFKEFGGMVRPGNEPGSYHRASPLTISVSGKQGGGSGLPGVKWAMYVKRQMAPRTAPACTVYDVNGTPIAKITVDPVTGKRSRVPFEEEQK